MYVQGTTNLLPPIQGNTQVLPTITAGGVGANTVLQDTALAGMADENGFFGTTATTNDIFGNTLNSEGTDFLTGANTITTNAYGLGNTTTFGTTETLPTIGAADPFLGNATITGTQILPGTTTTDVNTVYGTTAFATPGVQTKTTTTTTKTTYNTAQNFGVPVTTTTATYGTDPNLYGFQQNIQSEYQATNPTSPDSTIGYGTTAADFIAAQPTTFSTTTPIETTTTQTTTTTYENTVPTPATTITVEPQPVPTPIETIPPPQPQPVIQTQTVLTTTPVVNQTLAVPGPVPPPIGQTTINRFGIIDEDFRRGRPIYNENQGGGVRLLHLNNNNNLPVRPIYNVGINRNPQLIQPYGGAVVRTNNVPLGTGLDRLGRGGSYDVYGRGLNPLYNRVGLTPINTNPQVTGNIKDFL